MVPAVGPIVSVGRVALAVPVGVGLAAVWTRATDSVGVAVVVRVRVVGGVLVGPIVAVVSPVADSVLAALDDADERSGRLMSAVEPIRPRSYA